MPRKGLPGPWEHDIGTEVSWESVKSAYALVKVLMCVGLVVHNFVWFASAIVFQDVDCPEDLGVEATDSNYAWSAKVRSSFARYCV